MAAGLALAGMWGCDGGNGPECERPNELTVDTPTENDTVALGENITVTWRYPEDWTFEQLRIFLSPNSGLTFPFQDSADFNGNCRQSYELTIPDDASYVTEFPAIVKITDYDQTVSAKSEQFTIVESK